MTSPGYCRLGRAVSSVGKPEMNCQSPVSQLASMVLRSSEGEATILGKVARQGFQ